MFKVEVASVAEYFAFDRARRPDLEALDAAIRASAPGLGRYFHAGTPRGQPGMRFRMIGYGLHIGETGSEWPRIGVALQKNYISVYLLDAEALELWRGRLGELRMGKGNFSFQRFQDLDPRNLAGMLADVAHRSAGAPGPGS